MEDDTKLSLLGLHFKACVFTVRKVALQHDVV